MLEHIIVIVWIRQLMISDYSHVMLIYCFRIERLKKFVKAITRPSKINLAPIRVKDIYRFEEIEQLFERYVHIVLFGSEWSGVIRLSYYLLFLFMLPTIDFDLTTSTRLQFCHYIFFKYEQTFIF